VSASHPANVLPSKIWVKEVSPTVVLSVATASLLLPHDVAVVAANIMMHASGRKVDLDCFVIV
jgi:hypothetical protein